MRRGQRLRRARPEARSDRAAALLVCTGLLLMASRSAAAAPSPAPVAAPLPNKAARPGSLAPPTRPVPNPTPGVGTPPPPVGPVPILPESPGLAPGGTAIPTPLTVEEAVHIATARNPQTAAGIASAASAEASYRSLKAFPDVTLGVTHVLGTSNAPSLTGQTTDTILDLGDTFDTSGQRRFQAAGARAQWLAAGYQLQETRLSLAQQVRDAYWGLVAARSETLYAAQTLEEGQHLNELTRLQEQAGNAPHVDVIRSSIAVANNQQAYLTAQVAETAALNALNALLARPPQAPVVLADNFTAGQTLPAITAPGTALGATTLNTTLNTTVNTTLNTTVNTTLNTSTLNTTATSAPENSLPATTAVTAAPYVAPQLPPLPNLAVLTQQALANRGVVKAAKTQLQAAGYAVKQARAQRLPDLSLDYERSVQVPVDSIVLAGRLPVLDFGATRQAIKAADESRKQAQAQEQLAEQQVAQQVAQAYADYDQAVKIAASTQTDILTPSVTLLQMAQLGYQQGATGILPVIDAQSTLRSARTGYINSLLALYRAQDEIEAAIGGAIPAR